MSRALFGLQVAFLAIEYGIDLEERLASIVPPELRGEIDKRREEAWKQQRRRGAGVVSKH